MEGQRGIISCLKFNPDYSGAYAAGSYARNVTIYAENMRESVLELDGIDFGVTCMKWSPCGHMLWAGKEGISDSVSIYVMTSIRAIPVSHPQYVGYPKPQVEGRTPILSAGT